jgi:hypothetical protein
MRRVQIIGALCLAIVGCLIGAVYASAAPTDPWQYKFTFGEALHVKYGQVVVNHQTGNVLVVGEDGNIHQFDSAGDPLDFPAVSSPQVPGSPQVGIDNSGGPTQGNFYAWGGTTVRSYHADGSLIAESDVAGLFESLSPTGLYVTPDGTLWLFGRGPGGACFGCNTELIPMTPELVPAGPREFISEIQFTNGYPFATQPVADGIGNLYLLGGPGVEKRDIANGFTKLGDTGLTIPVERSFANQLAVDPATNDIFLAWDTSLNTETQGFKGAVPAAHSNLTPSEGLDFTKGVKAAGGVGFDGAGQTLYLAEGEKVNAFHREPPSAPRVPAAPQVTDVRSVGAILHSPLIDDGAPTTYHYEYGTSPSYGGVSETFTAARNYYAQEASGAISGLQPDTTYHARIVATNAAGTSYGPDTSFKTYPVPPGEDLCPNALARKQTIAQRLPDCRAYELVSARDTGGYDVESFLAPGQSPFPGFSLATDKLLYATHSGAVPGPWGATNKGPDPYVATRTTKGWVTEYKGLPSDLPAAGSFSSVLGEADSSLSTLAFAGPNLCSPCFTNGGLRTGIPVRLPSGQLVQGMAGALAVDPSAKPEGKVAKYFSGDGNKLLFASKYAFEPGANDDGSDLTVYARNLAAGTTEIVSTDPSGNALSGEGLSELDVSANGSRVVFGKKLGTDPFGNELIHPYLHIAGRPGSIDLAPLAGAGVLYAGMTSDGSKLFFTSPDKLIGSDTDSSADLYEADVDGSGNLTLKAITANNSDACAPLDCSAAPISGGGGVASATGAIYFLSPEQFGGQGTLSQPNLYLARPNGSIVLVATLEPNNPLLLDSLLANATRRTGDFQTTPTGNYATFTSKLVLANLNTGGFFNAYRFDAGSGQLDCASCDTTGANQGSVFADAELPPTGLALLADGRLFFTTAAQLQLNDPNGKKDVYEWKGGNPQLVSAGSGPFDSALLTVSADGTDVFFFTHDNLANGEDENGSLMRIYDAREGGGFFKLPTSIPCQASDECHGAGTPIPGPADIKSSGKTTQGNVIVCAKNRVKKRGKCVKKQTHAKKKHHKKRKGGAKKRAAGANGKRGGRNA